MHKNTKNIAHIECGLPNFFTGKETAIVYEDKIIFGPIRAKSFQTAPQHIVRVFSISLSKIPAMKEDNTDQIKQLKEEVIMTFGGSLDSPIDYEALAEAIKGKTKLPVSATTLKRVFGYIKSSNAPSGATLGILARYCGYAGWADWCAKHGLEAGNKKREKANAGKMRIAVISAASLLIAAVALTLILSKPQASNKTEEQPAAISKPPAFEETDSEILRYQELLKYCTDAAAVKCDSVRSRRDRMTMDEYYQFAMQEYSRILNNMRSLSEQCTEDAFKGNDTLQRMYAAQIFSACREVCLPLWIEAHTEYQDSLQASIKSYP